MASERWMFYTDLFGLQRWEQIDARGETLQEADHGFSTRAEALEDAFRHGYPGTQAISLTLQCKLVSSTSAVAEKRGA